MRLYLESTIPSYVIARPARDLLQASRQQLIREWWELQRAMHEPFISHDMTKRTKEQKPSQSTDPVLQKIWRIKDTLSASYDQDVKRLFVETRKRETLSGHPLVAPPKRRKV